MLGLFISIGLIIDSQTMLFKFITIYANEDLANIDETILSQGRCSFLSESVSTFGVSFSFCVLSSIIMYLKNKKDYVDYFILYVLSCHYWVHGLLGQGKYYLLLF